jgi:hypothetical protein
VIDRHDAIDAVFQVDGAVGAEVECLITVARTDENPGVAYIDTWRGPVEPGQLLRHRVAADRLEPGRYRLEATVRDRSGGLARRWREFVVVDRSGGK